MNNLYWPISALNIIIFTDFFYAGLLSYFVHSYSFGFFLILYPIIIASSQIQIWKLGFDFTIHIHIISACKCKENITLTFI